MKISHSPVPVRAVALISSADSPPFSLPVGCGGTSVYGWLRSRLVSGCFPEFLGIYAVVDGKLAAMIGGRGTSCANRNRTLEVYNFQKMAPDTETVFALAGGDVHFIVFDAAVADTVSRA